MEWIKVEDDLPESGTACLITARDSAWIRNENKNYLLPDTFVDVGWLDKPSGKWCDICGDNFLNGQVIAWMPLPKPFKYEGEELTKVEE